MGGVCASLCSQALELGFGSPASQPQAESSWCGYLSAQPPSPAPATLFATHAWTRANPTPRKNAGTLRVQYASRPTETLAMSATTLLLPPAFVGASERTRGALLSSEKIAGLG
jgi:hypothetical protein